MLGLCSSKCVRGLVVPHSEVLWEMLALNQALTDDAKRTCSPTDRCRRRWSEFVLPRLTIPTQQPAMTCQHQVFLLGGKGETRKENMVFLRWFAVFQPAM